MKNGNKKVEGAAKSTAASQATTKTATEKVKPATTETLLPTPAPVAETKPAKVAKPNAKQIAKEEAKAERAAIKAEREAILNAPVINLPDVSVPPADLVLKGVVPRQGQKFINPLEIVVNWKDKSLAANPRTFYGTPAQWKVWKESILDEGFKDPVRIFKNKDGNWQLRHGFRRMKAWHEIYQTNPALAQRLVKVMEVADNEIEAQRDHLTLNSSLPLSDIEKAYGIRNYMKLIGGGKTMVAPIARELGIEYVKATQLFKFIQKAHKDVVQAMNEGILTLDVAKQIIKASDGKMALQAKMVAEGREQAEGTKTKKIRTYHIKEVARLKEPKSFDVDSRIVAILEDAKTVPSLDCNFVNRMLTIVSAIKEGRDEKEIEELLAPMEIAS